MSTCGNRFWMETRQGFHHRHCESNVNPGRIVYFLAPLVSSSVNVFRFMRFTIAATFSSIYISWCTASSVAADAEILRARWRAELRAMPSCRYISRALYYSHCQRFAPATFLLRVVGDVLTQYRRDSLFVIFYRYRGYIRNSSES